MFERYNPANWSIDWTEVTVTAGEVLLAIAVAIISSYIAYRVIFGIVHRITHASETEVDELIVERLRRPVKWSFIAIGLTLVAQVNSDLQSVWEPLAQFLRPALLGWIAYTLVKAFTVALELRLESSEDPVAVRSRRTRIAVLSRTATVAIVILTVGLMLFSIPSVQAIGTTMLASAGLAALAVGAAAQPALKSLIAGLQVALTEPLRIGDLVKVDGEAGRVEEVRMSFITVRTWDERVLIVPTSRFLDGSFENWSRKSEKLTGPVFLHLDPAAEIEPIRAEFIRFVEAQELYDGRNLALVMTEAYPESIELRLSMSAETIGDLFQLRCAVREHMLAWLKQNQPEALIRHRLEVEAANARASGG
ncbi:small-conductance mechanosensitive channel [Altererythrobacter epoxidivorans]|uniref:Small-conductance mechanosensitive channel n=1 Tax=Altererythrobacter epoxidivorans TaxID=361183 RepID=A0A0M5L7M0_9SPHN|nr:mechanosensitive ion channel domain-containing protein [Altererythrobacter epoxidivorans]ALE18057.1 small-conductance mechanosensitive channel [Altererythrobacter epoxidivorans]